MDLGWGCRGRVWARWGMLQRQRSLGSPHPALLWMGSFPCFGRREVKSRHPELSPGRRRLKPPGEQSSQSGGKLVKPVGMWEPSGAEGSWMGNGVLDGERGPGWGMGSFGFPGSPSVWKSWPQVIFGTIAWPGFKNVLVFLEETGGCELSAQARHCRISRAGSGAPGGAPGKGSQGDQELHLEPHTGTGTAAAPMEAADLADFYFLLCKSQICHPLFREAFCREAT